VKGGMIDVGMRRVSSMLVKGLGQSVVYIASQYVATSSFRVVTT
jgi:hypothetical protein